MAHELNLATEMGRARSEHYQKVLQACQDVLALDTTLMEVYHAQGLAQLGLGQLQAAIDSFQTAILSPTAPASWYADLGIALLYAGKPVESGIKFIAALARDPNCAKVHFGLGQMHAACGDYTTALEKYQHTILLDPQCLAASAGIGLLHLAQKQTTDTGRKYVRLPQLEAAQCCFETVITQDCSVVEALYGMGEIYRLKRSPAIAVGYYEAVLLINNSFAVAHYKLGKALASLGDLSGSLEHLIIARQLNPHNTDIGIVLNYQLEQLTR